jgi:DNA-directed RNA polymerase beta' subunit
MASVQLGKKYVDDISTIVGVQFGILSPEEIVRRSAVNITESTFYDSNGEPKINGLFDPRMGVIERGKLCKTCEQTYIPCPGHFGHIELAKPVFYIQFINQIQELMKCVCIRCSKLLLDMNDTSIKAIIKMKKSDEFLNLLSSKVKTKVCGQFPNMDAETASSHGCGAIQPNKYITKELDYIVGEWQRDVADDAGDKKRELVQQRFTPEMVLSIFKRISIDDARILGFSPDWCLPHWMICVVLPVVPPAVRPSVRQYNNQRSEDDLTQKYNDIIKHNDMIKKKLANKDISEDQINGYVHLLQYDIATLIDNDGSKNIPPSMTKGGRQIKAFKQRLNGKDGRVRNNLMGKRVDFSARSVISPDSNLNIEELGVPLQIAMNLTVPEIVNKYNIDRVYQFVRNGANIHPGAKSYKKAEDGRVRNLEYMDTSKIVLHYGDIVNRHMMDGDPVLFNRQPSLHKMSAMSHLARVMDRLSFGLNINVCEPYNADFDGDEMNLHVPQSIQATMELKYLPAVSKQIISPSYNTPIIKPAQDNLLGLYKITDDSVYFNQRDMMNLLMDVVGFDGRLPEPAIKDTRILWTGKQLVSIILPPISMKKGKVIIEKGIIKQGQINKGASNEIVHIIFSDYGHLANQRYLNNLQKIVIRYMIRSGYSVGISDLLVHADIRKRNEETIVKGKQAVADITRKIHLNTFEDISHDISEVFEGEISAIIGKTSKAIEDNTVNLISDGNRVKYMVDAGTKGKMTNFTMMCCLVDQQSIDNKRISLGFSNRSLPHFTKYDNGMDSKGYISHNYLEGLTPQEFYFHAMAGREGLIDTAVKTARSGYLQRKLIKATEDLKVQHDYTVRNSNGDIVQFLYGDDGFNSIHLENMTFKNIFLISQADLDSLILLKSDDDWKSYLTAGILEVMRKTSKVVSQRFKEYNDYVMAKLTDLHETYKKYLKAGKGLDSIKLYFPINFDRIIGDTMKKYNLDKTNKSDLNPIYIIDAFDALVKRCVCHGKTNDLMELLIIDYLSVPRIIKELRLTKIAFDHLIIAIEARFKKSLVQGGEMVGPLAAQSIGEVSTQLTLRSVDWDTGIIISCDGVIQTPIIGKFIDDYYDEMMKNPERSVKIQRLENDQIYIPLENDGHEWLAYSVNEFGVGMWTKLEAITRHPVINEDGSDTILEVELEDGRIVKATKAKSFLVYNEAEMRLVDTNGSDLKVGDMLPVVSKFDLTDKLTTIDHINMRDYLPPNEYIYGTEIHKALKITREATASGDRGLYNREKAKGTFIVPYGRSDAFRDAFINGHNTHADEIREGFVYNKTHGRGRISQIPDKLMLDYDFGYFCGAYLADGMANELRIIISKHDKDFIKPICDLMARWNIGYRYVFDIKKKETATNKQWASSDHIFQSVMLAHVIGRIFGHTCEYKVIPAWVLQAPTEFQKGLISGYFSGDGSVSNTGEIDATSISRDMLNMIALLLKRFGINTSIHKNKQDKTRFPNCKDFIYNINVYKKYNTVFHKYFTLTINKKQNRIREYLQRDLTSKLRFSELNEIIAVSIKSIKTVQPSEHKYSNGELKRWVYDLTVAETRNFCQVNSVIVVDTFHAAGNAAASSVNQGVPRLDELLNKQTPKKTQLQIYLTDEHNETEEKADEIRYNLELVKMSDILLSDAIYAEPSNNINDVMEEDRAIMKLYEVFSELDPKFKQIPNNPWIIRLEFNRREMINKKITMEDINLIIQHNMPNANIVFTDDNAGKMIFRIRLNFDSNTANADDDISLLVKEIKKIKNITIKGIDGIQNVFCQKNVNRIVMADGLYKTVPEYYLLTNGSNLMEVLTKPYVDSMRTSTIDVIEAYHVLGVEAARWLLENQFHEVFGSTDKFVSPRHIGLVCDLMTSKGKIMAANRNGINNSDIGPFAKISFEETIRQLKEAGLFGKYDHMVGVSSNIMFGQIPSCGTGDSEILLDEQIIADYIKEHPTLLEPTAPEDSGVSIESAFGTDGYCDENQDINFNFSSIEGDCVELGDLPSVRDRL